MFGMGWTELLLVGIVALIVVGPKDLPVLFRNIGKFAGKAKAMGVVVFCVNVIGTSQLI